MSSPTRCLNLEGFALIDHHRENGFAGVGHGAADSDVVVVVGDAVAVGFGPDESVLAAFVHEFVEVGVAPGGPVEDPDRKPVGVEHSVEGHRVHDGHQVAPVVQVGVVQVVGQDSHGAGGAARCLAEESGGSGAGMDHRWRRLTAAAL